MYINIFTLSVVQNKKPTNPSKKPTMSVFLRVLASPANTKCFSNEKDNKYSSDNN